MRNLYWITSSNDDDTFPPVENALTTPNGLLAAGGTLNLKRLIYAYRHGIFPWYGVGQPILWWAPDPRSVLYPDRLKVSRSLKKTLRKGQYRVTLDMAFTKVIASCAAPRTDSHGTWITPEMTRAYIALHERGIAHSVETWSDENLVGGLYGIALGRIFFGESMFSLHPDASKTSLVYLVYQLRRWGFAVVDCQIHSSHLESLGAETIPRQEFVRLLDHHVDLPGPAIPWRFDSDLMTLDIKKSVTSSKFPRNFAL
ncbi:Leucyl/phenylalanyl-tRNA--protein transferase [Gammaproteobacteria bacterium]